MGLEMFSWFVAALRAWGDWIENPPMLVSGNRTGFPQKEPILPERLERLGWDRKCFHGSWVPSERGAFILDQKSPPGDSNIAKWALRVNRKKIPMGMCHFGGAILFFAILRVERGFFRRYSRTFSIQPSLMRSILRKSLTPSLYLVSATKMWVGGWSRGRSSPKWATLWS